MNSNNNHKYISQKEDLKPTQQEIEEANKREEINRHGRMAFCSANITKEDKVRFYIDLMRSYKQTLKEIADDMEAKNR